ncbi:chemotaxis protein MotB [Rhizomicrobium palustre]|uniref:Chemotaxis protein MotB n=1 Tax=Rhizomicrobium palustre TaxID=189966 RepID=A0A846N2P1_9PROT|nr:chemotaxis protein MotB [Rhizomicrobium palustre]
MADQPIVIKRIKKGEHAHHGGAWKVAYADFVTAMMAFFLLMWLINTTTPEQKRGIADYFAPQSISQTVSGAGGVLGGKVMGQETARAGGATSMFQKNSPPSKNSSEKSAQNGSSQGGSNSSENASDTNANAEAQSSSTQNGDFAHAAEAIRQAIADNPDIAQLSKQVMVDQTPDGMRIQLVDQDGRPMFQQGTSTPMPYTRKLLETIAKVIDRLPNRVSISGHTEGKAFTGPRGMTNWELSAERANAGRAILSAAGLNSDRIYEVAGKAGAEPLLPEDPNASANRRLSIVLMREAPPVPVGHQL